MKGSQGCGQKGRGFVSHGLPDSNGLGLCRGSEDRFVAGPEHVLTLASGLCGLVQQSQRQGAGVDAAPVGDHCRRARRACLKMKGKENYAIACALLSYGFKSFDSACEVIWRWRILNPPWLGCSWKMYFSLAECFEYDT